MFASEFEKTAINHSTLRQMVRSGLKERLHVPPTQKLNKELRDKIQTISVYKSIGQKDKARELVHGLRAAYKKNKAA